MAMMISKFHRLIQSRLLWGAFLVIIVLSFVVWGIVWPSDLDRAEQANAAGILAGENVGFGEFRSAYLSTYLARALALGREADSTPRDEALLRELSWRRLATLREAAKLGITASEDELVTAIRANFSETNGVYNRERYQAFLQNIVAPLGFSAGQFENHLREEIVIQKLGNLIGRQAHVTPLEVRQTFETLMDEFTVEYALVNAADVEKDVAVTEADARKLYEDDPAAFTIPAQREVSYVAFPVAEFLDDQMVVPEEEILDYYELHIEEYTTKETDTNGQPREVVAELDEVKDGIVQALQRAAALEKADAAATDLAFKAIPDRDGTVPDFAAEAEKAGRKAEKLAPFARFAVPLPDAGAAFAAAAFELEPDAFDRVSAPLAGQDNIYVIYLEREIEPRVPAFDEAKEQVLAAARRKAVAEALAAKGAAVKEAAAAGLAAGRSFPEAVAAAGVTAAATEPFTGLSGSSSSNEVVQALVQAVVGFNQGEVADPVPFADGILVPYLKSRQAAAPATFDAYQGEIASVVRNRRAQGLFREWQDGLLAPDRFTDLQRTTAADAEPEEDVEGLTDEQKEAAAAAQEAM